MPRFGGIAIGRHGGFEYIPALGDVDRGPDVVFDVRLNIFYDNKVHYRRWIICASWYRAGNICSVGKVSC